MQCTEVADVASSSFQLLLVLGCYQGLASSQPACVSSNAPVGLHRMAGTREILHLNVFGALPHQFIIVKIQSDRPFSRVSANGRSSVSQSASDLRAKRLPTSADIWCVPGQGPMHRRAQAVPQGHWAATGPARDTPAGGTSVSMRACESCCRHRC